MINVAEMMILTSTGYACGMSTLVGFAIARRIKATTAATTKNLWVVASAISALLCGAAPIFLLGLLVFAYPDDMAVRALVFVGALALGMAVSFYLSSLDERTSDGKI
jgi:hypothetical protein